MLCFYRGLAAPRALHSFPTRRSSDLCRRAGDNRLHDALQDLFGDARGVVRLMKIREHDGELVAAMTGDGIRLPNAAPQALRGHEIGRAQRLNSSHVEISYAVFCLKKKNAHDESICSRFICDDNARLVLLSDEFRYSLAGLFSQTDAADEYGQDTLVPRQSHP